MDWFQALVLALIQGLTEFLPISSSAHLILPSQVLGWPDQGLAFDVAEDALCDFESIESDVSRLLDAPKGESEPVAPRAASPVRALVDRVASLYSGKALPNDPTELRITGHDVYLAQQAQAELGGGV